MLPTRFVDNRQAARAADQKTGGLVGHARRAYKRLLATRKTRTIGGNRLEARTGPEEQPSPQVGRDPSK